MKFPSLNYLLSHTKNTFLRFPFVLISAILGVITAMYLLDMSSYNIEDFNHYPIFSFILCCAFGISLFFCVKVYSEKNKIGNSIWLLRALVVLCLILLYWSLPAHDLDFPFTQAYIRYLILIVFAHLLVSFAPYIKGRETTAFWNYNYFLFIRFTTAVFFSGVLYIGIVMAIGLMILLFEFEFSETLFVKIFFSIGGIFNTWFFLAGIPDDFEALEKGAYYPKELKVFNQYILLPLLCIYILILTIYAAKILISGVWPKGIVSYMVIAVSVLGIFTLLLMYPFAKQKQNKWINGFSKAYYVILIPLVGLLFYAIYVRVADYGITINRYLIILIGIWLFITSIHQIISKNNIKFIPMSLAVLLILILFGPWSMFTISEQSQFSRLKSILERNKLLENGKIINETALLNMENYSLNNFEHPNDSLINNEDVKELKSIVSYLNDFHDISILNSFFNEDMEKLVQAKRADYKYYNIAALYYDKLGVHLGDEVDYEYNQTMFVFETQYEPIIELNGADYYLDFRLFDDRKNNVYLFYIDDKPYYIRNDHEHMIFQTDKEKFNFDTNKLAENLMRQYNDERFDLPRKEMVFTESNEDLDIRIELTHLKVEMKDNASTKTNTIKGRLLLKKR